METDVPEKSEKERAEKQPVVLTTRMSFKEISQCVIEGGWRQTAEGGNGGEEMDGRQLFGDVW